MGIFIGSMVTAVLAGFVKRVEDFYTIEETEFVLDLIRYASLVSLGLLIGITL